MQETIKKRIPIRVDLAPNRDEVYSGICLKSNDEIFIFACFNEEIKEFDGYAIIRNHEIEKYREWDKEELNEIKNDNSSDFINKLPLQKETVKICKQSQQIHALRIEMASFLKLGSINCGRCSYFVTTCFKKI